MKKQKHLLCITVMAFAIFLINSGNADAQRLKPGNVPVETDLEVTRYWPVMKDVDYIVAAHYARGTAGYQGIPEQDEK